MIRRHRRAFIAAGRRGGKSTLCSKGEIWPELIRPPSSVPDARDPLQWPRLCLLTAPYENQTDIIFNEVLGMAEDRNLPLKICRRTGHKTIVTQYGSMLMCLSGKNQKAARGFKWHKIIADEMPLFDRPREMFQEVLFPCLKDTRGDFIGIGSPDAPGSFAHDCMIMGLDPNVPEWGYAEWPSIENWYLPWLEDEIEADRRAGVPDDIIDREYYAKWIPRTGLVYAQFHQCLMNEHEANDFDNGLLSLARFGRAGDFGFTNPFAALLIAELGETIYVFDEYYRTRTLIPDHADTMWRRWDNRYPIDVNIFDPESPGDIRQLAAWQKPKARLKGAFVTNYVKPAIIERVDTLRKRMAMGFIKIHPRCRNLIREFGTEKYPETTDRANPSENPIDRDNHGTSALGYYVDFRYGKISRDVPPFTSGEQRESDRALKGY